MSEIEMGSVYEINKQLIKQQKPLDPIEYATKIKEVSEKMFNDNTYYLLINNRDLHYYTLFNCKNSSIEGISAQVTDILSCLGKTLDIIPNIIDGEIDGFEIWIKHNDFNDPIVFYLLNWEEGVIECE